MKDLFLLHNLSVEDYYHGFFDKSCTFLAIGNEMTISGATELMLLSAGFCWFTS